MAILIHGTMALLRKVPPLRRFFEELGVKPKNQFDAGLFVNGGARLRRGAPLPQGLVRASSGTILLSDDALGDGLCLVGFGLPADPQLSAETSSAWKRNGGTTVQFCQRGERVHRGPDGYEDLDNRLVPGGAPYGWCAVLRPDRTVLHDGPIADADRIVRESLAVLGVS